MLRVLTKLGWDAAKGISVLAEEKIDKGKLVTSHDPSWDKVLTLRDIEALPIYQKKHIEKLMYQYEFGSDKLYIYPFGNEGYMNHSFDPSVDENGFATRDINIGQELTCDYTSLDSNCVKGSLTWLS